nr:DUF4309 domain-containing protein [Shimazuella soli]
MKKRAIAGKTTNSENFSIGSKTKDIVKKWGKPDQGSDAEYLGYNKRKIGFFATSGRVNLIVSNDKKYSGITYKEVKRELGKPSKERKGEDGIYVTYKAGKHALEIAFYYNKAGNAPDTIKEVSVY